MDGGESQINLLAKGLKFIPTSVTKVNLIRPQFLHNFEQFARRMRLQYTYYGTEKETHPFYVKSNWNPPVQQSVALERYLKEVKISLAEINLTKPKNNLPPAERLLGKALRLIWQENSFQFNKRNYLQTHSSKSQRNLNEEVVLITATTIAKPNFLGAAHNIIQKRTLPQRHTRESKNITKARKPNHVFRGRVGLSTILIQKRRPS